jgi:hypothetical protein
MGDNMNKVSTSNERLNHISGILETYQTAQLDVINKRRAWNKNQTPANLTALVNSLEVLNELPKQDVLPIFSDLPIDPPYQDLLPGMEDIGSQRRSLILRSAGLAA